MDPITDVFGRKVDPTRNQSASFAGADAFCVPKSDDATVRSGSRITQGNLELSEGGLGAREPTPERRSVPGQVLRGGLRPKDHLTGSACVTSDRQDHPLALPRKAGSAGPGTGSGGSVHIIAGPTGFVPAGQGYDVDLEVAVPAPAPKPEASGYKPVWG
ncbi:AMY1.4 [Symbiodinium natans]|uniref:AMY1.4 protein n=1 Tax=Symbiodinium natans TaxID=878477 RepID=A0A812MBG1_9DINO|nr:AMY1.4 [Symbiodinium natans]